MSSMYSVVDKSMYLSYMNAITAMLASVITSAFSILDLENKIVKNDATARVCQGLLIDIDRCLSSIRPIDDITIDAIIERTNQMINHNSIDFKHNTA